MSETPNPVHEDDLHAYVDDQLDAGHRAAVARYLETNPEAAERVAAYTAQRDAIRAAFHDANQGHDADQGAIPPHLTLAGILAGRSRQGALRSWLAAACILLALCGGGAAGWLLHTPPDQARGQQAMAVLTQEALASHAVYSVDRAHPVEVPGSQDAHLKQWFSNRLHRIVVVPDLSALGYRLIGGRLLATEHGSPAALLMYEDAAHQRISVLLRPMNETLRMPGKPIEQDGVNGRAWVNDGLGVAVVAALPERNIAAVVAQIASALRPTG